MIPWSWQACGTLPSRSSLPDVEVAKAAPQPAGRRPHFAVFGIPVRIHPGFFIMPVVLGVGSVGSTPQEQLRALGLWTAVVFFSVMLHEMGHALLGRAFGASPAILLHALGGVTYLDVRMSRIQSGMVSLAGPLSGLLFGFAVQLVSHRFGLHHDVLDMIFQVNIAWSLVNLIPV